MCEIVNTQTVSSANLCGIIPMQKIYFVLNCREGKFVRV